MHVFLSFIPFSLSCLTVGGEGKCEDSGSGAAGRRERGEGQKRGKGKVVVTSPRLHADAFSLSYPLPHITSTMCAHCFCIRPNGSAIPSPRLPPAWRQACNGRESAESVVSSACEGRGKAKRWGCNCGRLGVTTTSEQMKVQHESELRSTCWCIIVALIVA